MGTDSRAAQCHWVGGRLFRLGLAVVSSVGNRPQKRIMAKDISRAFGCFSVKRVAENVPRLTFDSTSARQEKKRRTSRPYCASDFPSSFSKVYRQQVQHMAELVQQSESFERLAVSPAYGPDVNPVAVRPVSLNRAFFEDHQSPWAWTRKKAPPGNLT